MSERIVQNFRGARALIVHRADGNRERLATSLRHLGLAVDTVDADGPGTLGIADAYDVLFFDADENFHRAGGDPCATGTACIALIGVEAPSRLTGVVRRDCCSYLIKPIRASGVYTALFIGMNELHRRRRHALERARLTERLQGRRAVTKAVLKLMRVHDIDDDEAYRRLRDESMRLRVSVEALARQSIDDRPSDDRKHELNRSSP